LSAKGKVVTDSAQKVFAASTSPEILGYYGTAAFPSQVLSDVLGLINTNRFFPSEAPSAEKWEKLQTYIKARFIGLTRHPCFEIIYGTRDRENLDASFYVYGLAWSGQWSVSSYPIPKHSGIIESFGTGAKEFKSTFMSKKDTFQRTTRCIFITFCEFLGNAQIDSCGGAPQLVGLYRTGPGRSFGVIFNSERFLNGRKVELSGDLARLEWRNELFERCNYRDMMRIGNAQKHSLPEVYISSGE
jgi:hypothetical protein